MVREWCLFHRFHWARPDKPAGAEWLSCVNRYFHNFSIFHKTADFEGFTGFNFQNLPGWPAEMPQIEMLPKVNDASFRKCYQS